MSFLVILDLIEKRRAGNQQKTNSEYFKYDHFFFCSRCGRWISKVQAVRKNNQRTVFCPYCGLKLRVKPRKKRWKFAFKPF